MPASGWVREFDLSDEGSRKEDIGTGHGRGAIEIAEGAAWVTNSWSRTLARLELPTREVSASMKLAKVPVAITAGAGALWVLCRNGWTWRVWPTEPRVEGLARAGAKARSICADDQGVWILRDSGELVQADPISGEMHGRASVGRGGRRVISGHAALWVVTGRGKRLLRVAPDTGEIQTEVKIPGRAVGMALHRKTLWITCVHRFHERRKQGASALAAVDADTGAVGASHPLPELAGAMTYGNDAIWIACGPRGQGKNGTIERFDLRTGSLETAVGSTGWPVDSLAVTGDSLLAAMNVYGNVGAGGGGEGIGLGWDMGGGGGGGDGGGGGGG